MRISDWSSDVCSSYLFQQAVFVLFSDTPHTLEKIYEDAIDVEKHGHGLALQEVAALYLIAPINEQDVHGAENPRITFRWDADVDLLGPDEFETQLFVSALRPSLTIHPLNISHRSEEPTSELQQLMRIPYAVFCLQTQNERQESQASINILK